MARRSSCLLLLALVLSIAPLQLHAQQQAVPLAQWATQGVKLPNGSIAKVVSFGTVLSGTPASLLGTLGVVLIGVVGAILNPLTVLGVTIVNNVAPLPGQALFAVVVITGSNGATLGTVIVPIIKVVSSAAGRKLLLFSYNIEMGSVLLPGGTTLPGGSIGANVNYNVPDTNIFSFGGFTSALNSQL